jgi:methylamine dehydrogenase accessory protein MauD
VDTVVLALRIVLAVVFATAGVGKLLDREGSVKALRDFGVAAGAAAIGGTALPIAELAVALGLLFPPTATAAAIGAIVLLLAFVAGISRNLIRGIEADCHCFGQIHSAPAGPRTLIRNGVLAALAVVVLAGGPGPAIDTWIRDRSGAELVAVVVGLLALAGLAAAVRFWLSNRELKQRLADVEAGLPDNGLPLGARAPGFSLKSTTGEKVTLESLKAAGKPILIVFVGPSCGPCWVLMPHLARWQRTLAERLSLVMISHGTERQNQEALDEHEIVGTFLHNGQKVMDAYRAKGTPTAVMLSPDGVVQATIVGARPIEPLVRLVLHGNGANGDVPAGSAASAAA